MQGTVKDVHYKLLGEGNLYVGELNLNIKPVEVEHCHVYKNKVTNKIIYDKPKGIFKYEKLFKSYGYELYLGNKRIFYSGDTGEYNIETDSFDEIYYDCSSYDIDGFPHIGLNTLTKKIKKEDRKKVYLMHFDNYNLVSKSKELGFNVVEVEEYNDEDFFSPRKVLKCKGKVKMINRGPLKIESHFD